MRAKVKGLLPDHSTNPGAAQNSFSKYLNYLEFWLLVNELETWDETVLTSVI
jgi:hypothetical protein